MEEVRVRDAICECGGGVEEEEEDLYQAIGNHILQILVKFHRNPMQRLEVMAKNVDFWPFLTTNLPNPGD